MRRTALSDLPAGWVSVKIADVTFPGETTDPSTQPDKEILYVDIGAIDNEFGAISSARAIKGAVAPSRARRVIRHNDVIISTVRTYLKNSAIVPRHLDNQVASTGFVVLRPTAAVLPEYLYHWIRSDEFVSELNEAQVGALYPAVRDRDVRTATIRVAPMAEQLQIVRYLSKFLGSIDSAISNLKHIPIRLQNARSAMLTETLVTSRQTNRWSPSTVSDVSVTIFDGPFGSNLKSADYVADGVRVVRLENIGSLRFLDAKSVYISESKFEQLTKHQVYANDVLFSSFVTDRVRVCRFPADHKGEAINKADVFCIRVDPDRCVPEFLEFRLSCDDAFAAFNRAVHGSTRPRINLTQLKSFTFRLPDVAAQREAVSRLMTSFSRIEAVEKAAKRSLETLAKVRAKIIADAFAGRLTRQNINEQTAESLTDDIRRAAFPMTKQKTARKSLGRVPAALSAKEFLERKLDNWPDAGLSFEDLSEDSSYSYDEMRSALFSLLMQKSPVLRQYFDPDAAVMRIKKVFE